MAKASDNLFPYVHLVPASAPSAPAAGAERIYLDSGNSNKMSRKNSSGTVTVIEGGGGLSAIPTVRAQRTAGNVTLNSATFVDIDTATDLTIAASAGDIIELGMNIRANVASGSIFCVLDFHTIVSAAPVNSVSSASAAGTTVTPTVPGWATGTTATAAQGYSWFVGRHLYTVQAGDISGGNVTFRLRGFSGGSVTLGASDPKLYIQAINFKH